MKTLKVGGRRQDLGKYRTGLGLRLSGHAEVGPRRHAGDFGRDRDPQPRGRWRRTWERPEPSWPRRRRPRSPASSARTGPITATAAPDAAGPARRAWPRRPSSARSPTRKATARPVRARTPLRLAGSGEKAAACRDCGACERACPYGVGRTAAGSGKPGDSWPDSGPRQPAQICQA
ncbi:MAG: hypothetical protein MZV64_43910 [Ignavibacteriales bacterium]|nr:hypothetical protein [Ignavibacteriales bacterium]